MSVGGALTHPAQVSEVLVGPMPPDSPGHIASHSNLAAQVDLTALAVAAAVEFLRFARPHSIIKRTVTTSVLFFVNLTLLFTLQTISSRDYRLSSISYLADF
jgi:hypothetical protein